MNMDSTSFSWTDSRYDTQAAPSVPAPSAFIPSPAMYQASQLAASQDSFLGHLPGHVLNATSTMPMVHQVHAPPASPPVPPTLDYSGYDYSSMYPSMHSHTTSAPLSNAHYAHQPFSSHAAPASHASPLDAHERAAVLEVLRMQCERLHLVLEMERLAQQERFLLAACQRQGLSVPGLASTQSAPPQAPVPTTYSHDAYASTTSGAYGSMPVHPHLSSMSGAAPYTSGSYPQGPLSMHSASAMSMSCGSLASTPVTSPAPSERSHSPSRDTPTRQGQQSTPVPSSCTVFTVAMPHEVFVNAAKEQSSCRTLQAALEIADPVFVAHVLDAVLPTAPELMMDPFGNYLMQKLMDVLDEQQRAQLLHAVAPDLVEVAQNMHGTRAVQRLADVLRNDCTASDLCEAVAPHTVAMAKDLNASHAVQRVIAVVPSPHKDLVVEAVLANLMDIACNRQGCCVVQRCIDHGCPEQRQAIISASLAQTNNLVTDPFGNYVIQYLLDQHGPSVVCEISSKIAPRVSVLACNKFSSNVIEKCLRAAPDAARAALVDGLCTPEAMHIMLHDGFANYVVQTALKTCANGSEALQFAHAIKPHLQSIRGTPHGKNIEAWLGKNVAEDGSVLAIARTGRAVYAMDDDESCMPQQLHKGRGRPSSGPREDSANKTGPRRAQQTRRFARTQENL